MKTAAVALGLAATAAAAGRPADTSICDYYTTALLKDNNATNQETLLTLVVNTAVIGNYTKPNVGIAVPGILANGTGNYTGVSLAPYFTGALASSNRGGSSGVSVNFLDGGAAAPLEMNKPANNTNSAQYTLLTHLYEYFGYLLGCSEFGNTTSPYSGHTSMYEVHKYMGLDEKEIGWFIENVGLSAASFGVAMEDVAVVGKALNDAFGYRCAPATTIPKSAPAALQAICIASDCPISPNATCDAYAAVVEPSAASGMPMATSNSSTPATTSGSPSTTAPSSSSTPYKGAASSALPVVSSVIMTVFGLIAFAL